MKYLSRLIIVLTISMVAFAGCRKEDATPYYNYIGGPGATTGDTTTTQTPDLTEAQGIRNLSYSLVDLSEVGCTPQLSGKGFIDNMQDFIEILQEWCANPVVPETVSFADSILAYFITTTGGCSEVRLKAITTDEQKIYVTIQTTNPQALCPCEESDKKWGGILAIDRVNGTTPEFVETTVEKPCE